MALLPASNPRGCNIPPVAVDAPDGNHLLTSGQVFVVSWSSVLAVIITRQSSQVDIAQSATMPISADLPTPCPDATAIRSGSKRSRALQVLADYAEDV